MFAVEVHVGAKYGKWLTGPARYDTREAASRAAAETERGERRCDATALLRRVVELKTPCRS